MRKFECPKCQATWNEKDGTDYVLCTCGAIIHEYKKVNPWDTMTLIFKGDWPGKDIKEKK